MNENNFFYFEDPYCFWDSYRRIVFQSLFIVFIILGIIFALAFLIFDISPLKEISPFLLFYFLYCLVKRKFPEKYIPKSNFQSNKKINVSYYAHLTFKETIILAKERFSYLKPIASLLIACLFTEKIRKCLLKLEISEEEIKEIQEKIIFSFKQESKNFILDFKSYLNQISQFLIEKAKALNLNYLDETVLFLALIEKNPGLEEIFKDYKIDKKDLEIIFKLNQLKKKITVLKGLSSLERNIFKVREEIKTNPSLTSRPTPLLDKYGLDFTELALSLKIGIMVGHEEEYGSLLNILTREGKRNALLIGPEGIGKETIVSFLAYNIVRDKVPKELSYHRLIHFSLASFLSSEKDYVSLFNILKKIVDEIVLNKDLIIYFKDFYLFKTFSDKSGFSALEVLRPLFDSPFIKIIADSPLSEYHRYLENHPLVKENFDIIEVKEVTPDQALEILAFRALELEEKRRINISFKATKRAIFLAQKFFKNIPLPGSAESILTEAIEGVKKYSKKDLREEDIVNLVSEKTEIPLEIAQEEKEKLKLLNLESIIHQYIVNQEEAVQLVSSYLRQYRSGLSEGQKPIGVFLFVGPTGVGKTELAKTLTKVYFGNEKLMIRFDMSEYHDPKSIFRLIGDPEGNMEGELTESVKRHPYSLLLLDEFEKAHPKVLDLFLQVFDEGRLTDNMNQVIDFTNTIIIATSNARSDYLKDRLEKGVSYEQIKEDFKKVLLDYFKPELLNRFDEVIIFKPLNEKNIRQIVKLKLENLKQQIKEKHLIELEFKEEVIQKLAQVGYNPILGARPLNSVIRKFIKDPLALIILSSKEKPKKIIFLLKDNQITSSFIE
jgi:ATP-dependent Clp protease ATP-binding subunit ClpC